MNVQKAKLPKGLSYPVQTGVIAAALQDAGVTLDCTVNYYNHLGNRLRCMVLAGKSGRST